MTFDNPDVAKCFFGRIMADIDLAGNGWAKWNGFTYQDGAIKRSWGSAGKAPPLPFHPPYGKP